MDLQTIMGVTMASVEELLAALKAHGADPRQIAVTKTQFETALLWAANAAGGESVLRG